MTIIVAGKLVIKQGTRDKFIEKSREPMLLARKNNDCEDFAVSPDPIDLNRVNVFEKWTSRAALEAFRGSGPENDMFSLVESFDVNEYEIDQDSWSEGFVTEAYEPKYSVWRQDDNGNIFLVKDRLTEVDAFRLVREYEKKGHKQSYWAKEIL